MSARFTYIRFVLALLTLLAIAARPSIPPNIHVLHPAGFALGSYGPTTPTVSEPTQWLNEAHGRWRCKFGLDAGANLGCGGSLAWSGLTQITVDPADSDFPICSDTRFDLNFDGRGEENGETCIVASGMTEGIANVDRNAFDASHYSHLRIKLHYEGRAEFLRVSLYNSNPNLKVDGRLLDRKIMSTFVSAESMRSGYADIPLSDFHVPEWWVSQNNPPRHLAKPAFDYLSSMNIDTIDRGVHRFELQEVMLVGDKISNTLFLSGLAALWLGFLLLEGIWRYVKLTKDRRMHAMQLGNLADNTDLLAKDNLKLQEEACTDALTGVLNRSGLYQSIQALETSDAISHFALIVIDIDHFKRLNDTYGHGVGDDVLQAFAKRVGSRIRQGDILARWGGEEFIVILRAKQLDSAQAFAENLRATIAATPIVANPAITISASLGVALGRAGESFDTLFKRADAALYRAKVGRNRVVCDEG